MAVRHCACMALYMYCMALYIPREMNVFEVLFVTPLHCTYLRNEEFLARFAGSLFRFVSLF